MKLVHYCLYFIGEGQRKREIKWFAQGNRAGKSYYVAELWCPEAQACGYWAHVVATIPPCFSFHKLRLLDLC